MTTTPYCASASMASMQASNIAGLVATCAVRSHGLRGAPKSGMALRSTRSVSRRRLRHVEPQRLRMVGRHDAGAARGGDDGDARAPSACGALANRPGGLQQRVEILHLRHAGAAEGGRPGGGAAGERAGVRHRRRRARLAAAELQHDDRPCPPPAPRRPAGTAAARRAALPPRAPRCGIPAWRAGRRRGRTHRGRWRCPPSPCGTPRSRAPPPASAHSRARPTGW